MPRYLLRSLKYLLQSAAMLAALSGLLHYSGQSGFNDSLWGDQARWRLLLPVMIVLAALYPLFGYVSRHVDVDPDTDREKMLRAFRASDYSLTSDEGQGLVFRASGTLKRAVHLWQDAVTVTRDGRGTVFSGPRREVVRVIFRLGSMRE